MSTISNGVNTIKPIINTSKKQLAIASAIRYNFSDKGKIAHRAASAKYYQKQKQIKKKTKLDGHISIKKKKRKKTGPAAKGVPPPSKRGFTSNMPKCARRTKLSKKKLALIQPKFSTPPPEMPNEDFVKVDNKWKCLFCPFTHKDKRELKQTHIAKHFLPQYECPDCDETWHIRSMFRQHHLWKCHYCDYKPLQIGALRRHIIINHPKNIKALDSIKGYLDLPKNKNGITINWRGKNIHLKRVEQV